MTARSPGDIAAFVPVALGFVPERSVVLASIGPGRGMHARVDLPHDPDDVDDVVEALVRPALRNGVEEVVVVVYDDDTTVADEAAWALHEELTAVGIGVREVLRVHESHWYAVLPGAPLAAYRGVPFVLAEHPFTAQAVFDGRVTHPSRDALRATIAAEPEGVGATAGALATSSPLPAGALLALARRHVERGTRFSVEELAAVAVTVTSGERRDEACGPGSAVRRPGRRWSSGPTPCDACPSPTWPGPRRCSRSRPGCPATGPSPGAPSTAAGRQAPPTPSPRWWSGCSRRRPHPTRGRPCAPTSAPPVPSPVPPRIPLREFPLAGGSRRWPP
jgi:hypothetical protein